MASVIQAVRRRAVETADALLEAFNREVIPVLGAVRDMVVDRNGRIVSVSADYTFLAGDQIVRADATDGVVTVTLTADTQMRRTVQKTDSSGNAVTVKPPSTDYTIHGSASVSLSGQWAAADFVFDEDAGNFFYSSTNS